ncbi:histidine-containing phosphotransfer protein 1-like [Diospyros lotus]|uniref:histidine-containing phosphotransfer protein 1-like n=1 Tax=Diospyros lotus TaxID=55363 RepID=UPI00225060F5|nr:histidine-containing phosphotransfer protein 1-like [Diospyros lotus]
MDLVAKLQSQFIDLSSSMYREGLLDQQFAQLKKLQDDSNPDFVLQVVSLYFNDSEKLLNNLATALQQQIVDFKLVDSHVHKFKGSSSSIGAQRVRNVCINLKTCCEVKDLNGCMACLQQLKYEFDLVKSKLETLFRLEQKIVAAGGTVPVMG